MNWCGIDPGKEGGIVFYLDSAVPPANLIAFKLPYKNNVVDVCQLQEWFILFEISAVVVEIPFIVKGKFKNYSSMTNFGMIRATVELCGIEYREVKPKKWQSKLGLTGNKQSHINWCLDRDLPVPMTSKQKNARHHDGVADAWCILMSEVIE